MSAFGSKAVETLAQLLWGDECVPYLDASGRTWSDIGSACQDQFRAKATAMLVPVAEANREHLTQRVAKSMLAMHAGDRDLAESIVRDVYGS